MCMYTFIHLYQHKTCMCMCFMQEWISTFYLSWPPAHIRTSFRHILNLASVTILELITQLATTLGFEDHPLTPVWFFSVNLISTLGLHSLIRKRCYHGQVLILYDRPGRLCWMGISLQVCRSWTVSGSSCSAVTNTPRALCSFWNIGWIFG